MFQYRRLLVVAWQGVVSTTMMLIVTASADAARFHTITSQDIDSAYPYAGGGFNVRVTAISGDGATVAGQAQLLADIDCASNICGITPFSWSPDGDSSLKFVTVPTELRLETHKINAHPFLTTSLSHDGSQSLIVSENGYFATAIYQNGEPDKSRSFADPPFGIRGSDMSADGSVVIGSNDDGPFRWEYGSELQSITGLPTDQEFDASAISGDGRVVLINAQTTPLFSTVKPLGLAVTGHAQSWTADAGFSELPPITGDVGSYATALSYDGSTIVGNSLADGSYSSRIVRAVRWSADDTILLDGLPGFVSSSAADVSGDGQTVVGQAFDPPYYARFDTYGTQPSTRVLMWNAAGDAFDLKTLLESEYGLAAELDGWTLTNATAISDNGLVIAGRGIDPNGISAGWVVQLAVPEPTTIGLLACSAIAMFHLRGRRRYSTLTS